MLTAFIFWLISIPVSFLLIGLSNNILTRTFKSWGYAAFPRLPSDALFVIFVPMVNIVIALVCICTSSFMYVCELFNLKDSTQSIFKWFNGE